MTQPLFVRVLGYRDHEEAEWVALALEMGLRGRGLNFEEAFADLREMIDAQISFAAFKGMPELLSNPAERDYFEKWEELQRQALTRVFGSPVAIDDDYDFGSMPISSAQIDGPDSPEFVAAGG